MKKVWIGLGIGCGVILLVGIGLVVAGGFWVKKNLEGAANFGKQVQAQEKELAALDQRFGFTPPPAGQPLKLEAARVDKYFAVRDALQPAFSRFEDKSKEMKGKKPASVSDALNAAKLFTEVTSEARAAFIAALTKQEMSRREFNALSSAIIEATLTPPPSPEQIKTRRQELEASIKDLEKKIAKPLLAEEDKAPLQEELDASRSELESLPSDDPAIHAIFAANAKLLEPYKDRFEKSYNPLLDGFLGAGGVDHRTAGGKGKLRVHVDTANDGDSDGDNDAEDGDADEAPAHAQ